MGAIFDDDVGMSMVANFFGRSTAGYFVDVGANNPIDGSQTWHLEQLGWKGVLVEPQPNVADRLRKERRAQVFAVALSEPSNSGRMMPLTIAGYNSGNCSSLDPNFFGAKREPYGVRYDVPVRTLDDVLAEAGAPRPLDFVSIDVEGHEPEVLQGFDLVSWNPRLLLIEDHAMNLRVHRHMTAHRYRWVRRTGFNSWYVPFDSPMVVDLVGRWQFVRKYVLGIPFHHVQATHGQLKYITRPFRRRVRKRVLGY
jgi:FkbM family methyltransferase